MFIEKLNHDVRQAKGAIPNWVIASQMGVHENTFNRWMRQEMEGEKKTRVIAAIAAIKAELEENGVSKITKDSRPAAI